MYKLINRWMNELGRWYRKSSLMRWLNSRSLILKNQNLRKIATKFCYIQLIDYYVALKLFKLYLWRLWNNMKTTHDVWLSEKHKMQKYVYIIIYNHVFKKSLEERLERNTPRVTSIYYRDYLWFPLFFSIYKFSIVYLYHLWYKNKIMKKFKKLIYVMLPVFYGIIKIF